MKVEEVNNKIVIYIYDKKLLNKKIKDIIEYSFNILEKYYDYTVDIYYYIKVYINKYYGIILELYNNDIEYEITLRIIKDALFLYKIEDPLNYLDNEIYYYDNNFYLNINKENINILEKSEIIYDERVYKILGSGIKI